MTKTYFKKVVGILMVGLLIFCWIAVFHDLVWDEIEDLLDPENGVFHLEDLIYGSTICLSLTYSGIRILENIFRKEKKES